MICAGKNLMVLIGMVPGVTQEGRHTVPALFAAMMNCVRVFLKFTSVAAFQLTLAYPQSALCPENMCWRLGVGYVTLIGLKAIE